MPDGGQLNPDAALPALQRLAAGLGAEIRHHVKVLELKVLDDGVRLTLDAGGRTEVLTARQAVVTAGGWTSKLLAGVAPLPRLTVTQEQPAHFAITDEGAAWPGFNHMPGPRDGLRVLAFAGLRHADTGRGDQGRLARGGPGGGPGPAALPPEPGQRAALQRYARDWLPGVDADSLTDISCTYTTTVDDNFVLDRIGPVVIGAGFSGHGFKFTPVVGRILADLATGDGAAPAIFSASRPGVR